LKLRLLQLNQQEDFGKVKMLQMSKLLQLFLHRKCYTNQNHLRLCLRNLRNLTRIPPHAKLHPGVAPTPRPPCALCAKIRAAIAAAQQLVRARK
jgi:hypothetical protein